MSNPVIPRHVLKKITFGKSAVLLLTFLLTMSFRYSYSQDRLRPEEKEQLKKAYLREKNPEISFDKFVELNAHIFILNRDKNTSGINSRDAQVLAPQDTYCAKVRPYCSNGNFEDGLDQDKWTGAYGTWTVNSLYPDPFGLTYGFSSGTLSSSASRQTIVEKSAGNDPYTGIPLVAANGGNRALRLGNSATGYGTEILAKTIVVDANESILSFYYAVVFEDPNHSFVDQPAFSVRAYDCATGQELPNVADLGNGTNIVVSDAQNPFFQSASSGQIAYRNWSLAQINLSAHVGKTVIIVFTNLDCGQGGHFGYTYLDNIFSNLCPVGGPILTGQGSVSLNSANTNNCGTGQICVDYTLPTSNNNTGTTNIALDIYQNGVKVTTLNSPTLSSGTSYCFAINPALLGLTSTLGGFDYAITGTFALSGFALAPLIVGSPPNGQIANANNDYLIVCPTPNVYYSKSVGNLHALATWGVNPDGSGMSPSDFGSGKTFQLVNRGSTYVMTGNWTVDGTINILSGSELQIGNYALSLTDLGGAGHLAGSVNADLNVIGTNGGNVPLNFSSTGNMLNNFTINRTGTGASATLGTQLNVINALTVNAGVLNTANLLTLKSTASNTARVAPVTGIINGAVTVERYIPARSAWRLLSAPISGSQTINQAWQEGATSTSANPLPNYGTFITGGSVANGFDQSSGASPSIKTYNSSAGWVAVPNTNATPVGNIAYMMFVYGNRNNITIPVGSTPGNTTLRAKGNLLTGNQTYTVNGTGFTAIPNPYASPINFAAITRSNVANTFYVWDPKIGGVYGVGAYVTISFNGTSYDVSSNAISPESQYIQSGQAFLVYPETPGTAGSITIKESDKSATAAMDVFRTGNFDRNTASSSAPVFADPTQGEALRISLQTINADGTTSVVDEVLASYKNSYSDKVDVWDAIKANNMAENMGILKEGKTLAIERRTLPSDGDNIQLNLWNTADKSYALEINPVNLRNTGLYAYLKDSYLNTTTPVSLSEISKVYFSVTANTASAKASRFSIVLSKAKLETDIVKSSISAYPNPVTGKNVNLRFNNLPQGLYQVTVLNSAGKTMVEQSIRHGGGVSIQNLSLSSKLPTGVYQVRITGKDSVSTLSIISIN